MMNPIVATVLTALAAAPAAAEVDTTFTVPEGTRLEVQNADGLIHVRGADGERMRIRVLNGPERAARVEHSGSVVRVSVARGGPGEDDFEEVGLEITVPRGTDLTLQGAEEDIRVEGVSGAVDAQNQDGGIVVRGPARSVRAQSADDDVVVVGARGDVDLYSMDGDVRVTGVEGEVRAESLDGDVVLRDLRSDRVTGNTTDGDLIMDSPLRGRGSYSLDTHDGDVWMTVPEGTNASFEVVVHDGTLEASFGLPADLERDRRTRRFVLGNGSARVELRSFDGRVYLRRPGEIPDHVLPDGEE